MILKIQKADNIRTCLFSKNIFEPIENVVVLISLLLIIASLFLDVISIPIHFDERLHLQYLWMIENGLRPHIDFFCHYPPQGYFFFEEILKRTGETAFAIIPLRIVSISIFLLIAFFSMYFWNLKGFSWGVGIVPFLVLITITPLRSVWIEYRTDGISSLFAFCSLATLIYKKDKSLKTLIFGSCSGALSLLIMPKFFYILATAYTTFFFIKIKQREVKTILLIVFGSLFIILPFFYILSNFVNTDPITTIKNSHILMLKFYAHVAKTSAEIQDPTLYPIRKICSDFPVQVLALLFLFIGSLFLNKKETMWIYISIFFGILITSYQACMPYRQYLTALFIPFLLFSPEMPKQRKIVDSIKLQWISICSLFLVLYLSLRMFVAVLPQFSKGELFYQCLFENQLTEKISRQSRVLSVTTPLFRFPLMYLTWNEVWGNPPGFEPLVDKSSRLEREFSADNFTQRLSANPPSFIQISRNLPFSWKSIIFNFVQNNSNIYDCVQINGLDTFILNNTKKNP